MLTGVSQKLNRLSDLFYSSFLLDFRFTIYFSKAGLFGSSTKFKIVTLTSFSSCSLLGVV